jgi:hypothetical protein
MTTEIKTIRLEGPRAKMAEADWKSLYIVGGVAALMVVAVGVLDTSLSFAPGGITPDAGKGMPLDWFTLLQGNWFLGLRGLGLFNIFNLVSGVLVFLALYAAHLPAYKAYAALAVILSCAGLAIYVANNPALPLLGLSGKYAAATTEAQRSAIITAGEALLARGEDFTPGAFWGFFLGEVAGLVISWVMLRGGIFGKAAAWVGLAGMGSMVVFTLWATFMPTFRDGVMVLTLVGSLCGLLSMAWYILIARRLFQFGRDIA